MRNRLRALARLSLLYGGFVVGPTHAAAQDRQLRVAVTVPGSPVDMWRLWSTDEGVRSFFAPDSRIEAHPDGWYEIYFIPQFPPGKRGADSMRVLAAEPGQRLMFTWNAPINHGDARNQRTVVQVDFVARGSDSTTVTLTHFGFGGGPQWNKTFDYFAEAWNGVVMPRFRHRVLVGPIDWRKPPALAPIQRSIKQQLTASEQ
jgi:uncharacterized protein YndB with AHSA1/START domain